MILIYTKNITPRLSYITKFIFSDILKVPYRLTNQWDDFLSFHGPKINYSFTQTGKIHIAPAPILTESEISLIDVPVIWQKGIPFLFYQNGDYDLPFDPFSASFYMVSRYEEYVNRDRDEHGRFQAFSSIAYKNGFLDMPVVDIWASLIRNAIEKEYPGYGFPEKKFSFMPTVDIDIAFAYKAKGILRTVLSTAKNIFDKSDQKLRWNALLRNKPDPFDTYHLFHQWHKEFNLDPVFFIHFGKYGKHDRSIRSHHPLMIQLVKNLASRNKVGIHPSYRSNSDFRIIKEEIDALASVTDFEIFRSRQHYLRFDILNTYQTLADIGIREEYSMGYAEMPGFRAGTCTPFNYYNLLVEKETKLKVYPFTFMDGNWIYYLQTSPEVALHGMEKLIQTVKKYNGTLITIWHNQTLSEIQIWKGWSDLYFKMLKLVRDI